MACVVSEVFSMMANWTVLDTYTIQQILYGAARETARDLGAIAGLAFSIARHAYFGQGVCKVSKRAFG
jgi:hypothetical protein